MSKIKGHPTMHCIEKGCNKPSIEQVGDTIAMPWCKEHQYRLREMLTEKVVERAKEEVQHKTIQYKVGDTLTEKYNGNIWEIIDICTEIDGSISFRLQSGPMSCTRDKETLIDKFVKRNTEEKRSIDQAGTSVEKSAYEVEESEEDRIWRITKGFCKG